MGESGEEERCTNYIQEKRKVILRAVMNAGAVKGHGGGIFNAEGWRGKHGKGNSFCTEKRVRNWR